jgi:hypothetical protein
MIDGMLMVELGWSEEQIANTSVIGVRQALSYLDHKQKAQNRIEQKNKAKARAKAMRK